MILGLNPITKTTVLVVEKKTKQRPGRSDPMRWVEQLRALAEKGAQPAGKRLIGDIEAQGFRIQEGQRESLVWADPKTRLPVQVEISFPDGTRGTYRDFRFNPELDDALFSLEVPKGYKVQPFQVEDVTPEEHLVRALRFYAETSAGKFPTQLENPVGLMIHLIKNFKDEDQKPKDKDRISPEGMRLSFHIVRAGMFVASLKGDYRYKPEGTKLGDAQKMVFWYRPEQAKKYRVLYADLHWADVAADELPKP